MGEIVRLPAFVDMHDHFREPSNNPAETIASGTTAAILGGYGYTFDMPNNPGYPTHSLVRVMEKQEIARASSRTMIGFYAGWQPGSGTDPEELRWMANHVVGQKIYLTKTTGNERELEVADFMPAIEAFHRAVPDKPIMVHPGNEDHVSKLLVDVAAGMDHHVHFCHINDLRVAGIIGNARDFGYPTSSGLTPHHAIKAAHDRHTHGKFAEMMPELTDPEGLLHLLNLGVIDVVETDHAPHSYEAKMDAELGGGDCYGVPNIDHAFAVMQYQVTQGRLDQDRLIDAMSKRPAEIMGIRRSRYNFCDWQLNTFRIEDEKEQVRSGAGWTPFLGNMATGKLLRLVLDGQEVFSEDGLDPRPLADYGIDPVITDRMAA